MAFGVHGYSIVSSMDGWPSSIRTCRAGGAVPAPSGAAGSRSSPPDRAHRDRARAGAPGRRGFAALPWTALARRVGVLAHSRRGRRSRPRPPAMRPTAGYAGRVVSVARRTPPRRGGLLPRSAGGSGRAVGRGRARISDDRSPARRGRRGALLVAYAHARWRRCCEWAVPSAHRGRRPCTPDRRHSRRLGAARLRRRRFTPSAPRYPSATPDPSPAGAAMPAVYRKDAQYWTVALDGAESRMKHSAD